MSNLLDILIATIPHRHDKLCELLEVLEPQMVNGVGVIGCRDNLEVSWTSKCNRLLGASDAQYVCHIDDDDLVSPDYIAKILWALSSSPDYVGFKVRWTQNGKPKLPVIHSLQYSGWFDLPDKLVRDITDKNVVKRTIAQLATWRGGNGADRDWAEQLRGIPKVEAFIDDEVYLYNERTTDTYTSGRLPMPLPLPKLPDYPWLRWIDP